MAAGPGPALVIAIPTISSSESFSMSKSTCGLVATNARSRLKPLQAREHRSSKRDQDRPRRREVSPKRGHAPLPHSCPMRSKYSFASSAGKPGPPGFFVSAGRFADNGADNSRTIFRCYPLSYWESGAPERSRTANPQIRCQALIFWRQSVPRAPLEVTKLPARIRSGGHHVVMTTVGWMRDAAGGDFERRTSWRDRAAVAEHHANACYRVCYRTR
jgi:hypothetical protein